MHPYTVLTALYYIFLFEIQTNLNGRRDSGVPEAALYAVCTRVCVFVCVQYWCVIFVCIDQSSVNKLLSLAVQQFTPISPPLIYQPLVYNLYPQSSTCTTEVMRQSKWPFPDLHWYVSVHVIDLTTSVGFFFKTLPFCSISLSFLLLMFTSGHSDTGFVSVEDPLTGVCVRHQIAFRASGCCHGNHVKTISRQFIEHELSLISEKLC